MFSASGWQILNVAGAQDSSLTRSRPTVADIQAGLEIPNVCIDGKRIKILCNKSSPQELQLSARVESRGEFNFSSPCLKVQCRSVR